MNYHFGNQKKLFNIHRKDGCPGVFALLNYQRLIFVSANRGASFILIAFGDNEFRSFYRSRAVYYPIKYESIIKAHYLFIYIQMVIIRWRWRAGAEFE